MGIPRLWMDVAKVIGVDAFLLAWRTLSQAPSVSDGDNRVYVPRYSTFVRYQRNRVIASLWSEGKSAREIKMQIKSTLGEEISEFHVSRIGKKMQ